MNVMIIYKRKEDISITVPELIRDHLKYVKNILSNGEYIEVFYEMKNIDKERGISNITRIPKEEIDEIIIKRD